MADANTDSKSGGGFMAGVGAGMSDTQRGLAWFIVIAFVLLTFLWMLRPPAMAPESMAQLNSLVGTLQNVLLIAIGFFFGSSKQSQTRDEAITTAALAPTPPSGGNGVTVSAPADTKTTTTTEPAAAASSDGPVPAQPAPAQG